MIPRLLALLAIIGAALAVVSVSLGAHIYRWEMIAWPASTAFWAGTAWIYETLARDR